MLLNKQKWTWRNTRNSLFDLSIMLSEEGESLSKPDCSMIKIFKLCWFGKETHFYTEQTFKELRDV